MTSHKHQRQANKAIDINKEENNVNYSMQTVHDFNGIESLRFAGKSYQKPEMKVFVKSYHNFLCTLYLFVCFLALIYFPKSKTTIPKGLLSNKRVTTKSENNSFPAFH